MQTLCSAHCRHWGKECVAASEAHVSICAHSDNFWVSNLLSAFLTVLPFLPPENPLLFQPCSPASSSLIQIPASLLPGLAHLCSRVVFPWSVLLGCCEEELGAWDTLLQSQSCGLLFSYLLQWDRGCLIDGSCEEQCAMCRKQFSEDVVDKL